MRPYDHGLGLVVEASVEVNAWLNEGGNDAGRYIYLKASGHTNHNDTCHNSTQHKNKINK